MYANDQNIACPIYKTDENWLDESQAQYTLTKLCSQEKRVWHIHKEKGMAHIVCSIWRHMVAARGVI